jgi:tetraacyldisaccharide 4'-kinase
VASHLESYAESLIVEPVRRGALADLLRGFLAGCAALYDVGLEAYLGLERLGLRRRAHLPLPIVSIGNLTVGGTGKTPMTQWLCRRLTAQGLRVAVLSRGHGGTGTAVRGVSDNDGNILTNAANAGDEPMLLAQTLPGVPIIVGKDRRLSGREAMRRYPLDALVLDDGFQYWQLARDLDIVLLDSRRPFDNGFPLPRGLLREPKRHLARACIVVVTRADRLNAAGRARLFAEVASLAPESTVFWARHQAVGLMPVNSPATEAKTLNWLCGRKVVALSGIAQPNSFRETLEVCGAIVKEHLVYNDHAVFMENDVEQARRVVDETGATALVMTEKDAVKWPQGEALEMPTYALQVEMQMESEMLFLETLAAYLRAGKRA